RGEHADLLPARRRRRKRWSEVPTLFEAEAEAEADADAGAGGEAAVDIDAAGGAADEDDTSDAARAEPAWLPRFASDDDLDGVLDADTPLLARAFRNVRGTDRDDEASEQAPR